jgi:hypothetical protein
MDKSVFRSYNMAEMAMLTINIGLIKRLKKNCMLQPQ